MYPPTRHPMKEVVYRHFSNFIYIRKITQWENIHKNRITLDCLYFTVYTYRYELITCNKFILISIKMCFYAIIHTPCADDNFTHPNIIFHSPKTSLSKKNSTSLSCVSFQKRNKSKVYQIFSVVFI